MKSSDLNRSTDIRATKPRKHVPDGGYGWIVVFAAMMCNAVVDGILYAFSVMKLPLQAHFRKGEGPILMIGSLAVGVYMLFGPLYTSLAQRFGCRIVIMIGSLITCIAMVLSTFSTNIYTMFFLYGILAGFGFGLVYLPSILMIDEYFDQKHSLATGIVVCGTGLGVLSFGQVAGALFDYYGWQGGMLILAGIMLNCAVFGALMKPNNPLETNNHRTSTDIEKSYHSKDTGVMQDGGGNMENPENTFSEKAASFMSINLLCDPKVLCICVAQLFGFFGYFLVAMLLVTVTEKQIGATPVQARLTMTVLGIVNTVARFVFGWMSTVACCNALLINNITLAIYALSCLAFPFYKTYVHMLIFSCAVGIFSAPFVGLIPATIRDVAGKDYSKEVLGLAFLFRGVSSIFGPTVGGILADATGGYLIPFMVSAASTTCCLLLHLLLYCAGHISCGPMRKRCGVDKQ